MYASTGKIPKNHPVNQRIAQFKQVSNLFCVFLDCKLQLQDHKNFLKMLLMSLSNTFVIHVTGRNCY